MEQGVIDAIGKLSVEVVAILALAMTIYYQSKNHEKICTSIDNLAHAVRDKADKDAINIEILKDSIDKMDQTVDEHRQWSSIAIEELSKIHIDAKII